MDLDNPHDPPMPLYNYIVAAWTCYWKWDFSLSSHHGGGQRPALIQLFVWRLSKCCWCSLVFPQPSDSSAIVVMIETCVKAALLPNHVCSTSQLEGPRLVQSFCLKRGWSSQRKVERDLKADVRTACHECKMAFPEPMSKLYRACSLAQTKASNKPAVQQDETGELWQLSGWGLGSLDLSMDFVYVL